MKKNKLKINAFEKYSISNANKINFKGGYPEGWTGEITLEDENTSQTGDDPINGAGGPGTTILGTILIKPNGTNDSTSQIGIKVILP